MQPHPTLDQFHVFLTVVDKGSFSAASRALNRTQSVISYTIANLEAQLGVPLFFRSGTKRPELTEAGRSVLEDARRLHGDLDLMHARLKALNDGLEGELSVAMTGIVPSDIVIDVLSTFRSRYPTVTLNVTVGTLGIVMDAVIHGRAAVGFGGAMTIGNNPILSQQIGHSAAFPVASSKHPLAKLGRSIDLFDVRDETQLVVYDASGLTKGRDFNVFSLKTWRVSDNATKHSFIRGGLGWGGLPESLVKEDISNGRLIHLDFPAFDQSQHPIFAIHNVANPPGPAARWLTSEFRERLVGAKGSRGSACSIPVSGEHR
ncbi:LysR family transcriptional regulator [Rhizobium sp. RCC_161_2]|uniref:LysR family transcriptional regulator n=1 Tax=Rhizobium sp. RCC_161_2 TaxID=3239219 RepID=UPI003524E9A7